MKLFRFENYSENWLDFVVKNRSNRSRQQAHDYDIVEDPIEGRAKNRRVEFVKVETGIRNKMSAP